MIKNVFVVLTLLILVSCSKEKVLTLDDYPSEIKTYSQTYFPENQIIQVIRDSDGFTRTYEVVLEETIQLEFNRKKEIIKVESENKIPDSVIPSLILSYVKSNFANNYIVRWEIDNKNHDVELDNGIELIFDNKYSFKRIED